MFHRKKKKKAPPPEKFVSLKANDVPVQAINFAICRNPDDTARLEIRTKDVCEALHYEEIGFELKTTQKMLRVRARFREAQNEKHFKVYIFDVEDYAQFFI